ncbi:acetyl-CoA carboxylase biotin carboxyl carrier protein subunit [Crocinitomicaceae bacterium]|nr:acetyl-CoA carboxylase biotin carboxyl carrier protein subunit [Crocinitomicaceae bacterium]MDO7613181.1 acetyl-CoA carboxylase biotin carboxyl carrier protein subunit [Crocinitomicaceae bacterium]
MSDNNVFLIDGEVQTPNGNAKVEWLDRDYFVVSFNGKTFNGEVLEQNLEDHTLKLKLNHRVFEVKRKYALLDLISQMGLDKKKVKKLKELSSPMPGRVLKIMVKIGDQINIGDSLLSLEAMKMENILKSDGEGVVKEIFISEQQVVDKGEVLIEFE